MTDYDFELETATASISLDYHDEFTAFDLYLDIPPVINRFELDPSHYTDGTPNKLNVIQNQQNTSHIDGTPNKLNDIHKQQNDTPDGTDRTKRLHRRHRRTEETQTATKQNTTKLTSDKEPTKLTADITITKPTTDKPTTQPTATKPPAPVIIDNITIPITDNIITEQLKRYKPTANIDSFTVLKRGGVIFWPREYRDVNILLQPWPPDAFGGDIYVHLANSPDMRPWFCINKVPHSMNISTIAAELKSLYIPYEGLHRFMSGNSPSTLIKFLTTSVTHETHLLRNKLNIEGTQFTIRKFINKTITRCTNCQKLGHFRSQCKHSKICVRCSGPSCETGNCKSSLRKCANCGGNHSAAFKSCPVYKESVKSTFIQKRKLSYADSVKYNPNLTRSATKTHDALKESNKRISQLESELSLFKRQETNKPTTPTLITQELNALSNHLFTILNLNQDKKIILNTWITNFFSLISQLNASTTKEASSSHNG